MERLEHDWSTEEWWSLLVDEVTHVPLARIKDGSGSSHMDGPEGWIHGLSMNRVSLDNMPRLSLAVNGLSAYLHHPKRVQVMVNKLASRQGLRAHKDGLPDHQRWHLPILSHNDVTWWDEREGSRHMDVGHWHGPVPYCGVLHSMHNGSEMDRYHVIVDFEKVS